MALKNPFISYISRSYEQVKSAILLKFPTFVPELTDHTENNIFVRMVSVWAGITELIGYYIDKVAQETFLVTQTRFESAVKVAKMFDYRVRGVLPASVDLSFQLNLPATSPINIPIGFKVKTVDDIFFTTTENKTIPVGGTSVVVKASQVVNFTNQTLGISNGQKNQTFQLNSDIADKTITILVGGNSYTHTDTFSSSTSTDTHFTTSIDTQGKMSIYFGDGINGTIPPTNATIIAGYSTSVGFAGNVAENSITYKVTIPSLLSGLTLDVTNINRSSGGADIESLEELKKRIPLSLRTLLRAVTRQDYIDIANLCPGVAKSGLSFSCGKTVDIYIVPMGGGVATNTLLTTLVNWFDNKRMVTTRVNALPAGEIKVQLEWNVDILPNYSKSVVGAAVAQNLLGFISVDKQEIGGTLEIGDIYQIIENTEGVNFSKQVLVTTTPYARPLLHTTPLLWNPIIKSGSTSINTWKIVIIGPSTVEIYMNSTFLGQFPIGSALTFTEVDFTIQSSASYLLGQSWEFKTYPYNQSLLVDEPSIPILYSNNLQLNLTGGF